MMAGSCCSNACGVGGEAGDGKQLAVIYVSGARCLQNSWLLGVKFANAETRGSKCPLVCTKQSPAYAPDLRIWERGLQTSSALTQGV